jgi:hypothetical protein
MKDGKIYKNTPNQTPEQDRKKIMHLGIKEAALSKERVRRPIETGNSLYFCAVDQAFPDAYWGRLRSSECRLLTGTVG